MRAARQLDLLKGPRQRGVKPKPALEFAVHCVLADTLRRWCEWPWFHVPNGGERKAVVVKGRRVSFEGTRLARMGTKPGVADFVFVGRAGRMHALELKRLGEEPTDLQRRWGDEVSGSGAVWAWADSYPAAVTILQEWGALPKTIKVQ